MNILKPIFQVSKLAFFLLFAVLLSCNDDDLFDGRGGDANIRIIQVNPNTDAVLIGNFGGSSQDISSYWLCIRKSYVQIGTLGLNASLDLQGNQFLVVDIPLNDTSSDVALYSSDDFSSPQAMIDFMQYGANIGTNGQVDVAVNKGIWEDGTFVGNSSPYTYIGDGDQNGVASWLGRVDQSGNTAKIRLLQVDPANGTITLKNFGSEPQNIANYFICNQLSYALVGTLTAQTDLILDPDETIVLQRGINSTASDVALYVDDAFQSANSMLDFMQYGADLSTAGQAGVAVTKGIWTTGTFVDGSAPFDYTGDGTEVGVNVWQGN